MAAQPTPEARADYNALLEALMPFAEQMLKKHGEFFSLRRGRQNGGRGNGPRDV
jgi:hypothetical protein